MSRRRGEFEHRTSIFEGAFRAWSHLGGLDPEELETRPATDMDPLTNPIVDNSRLYQPKERQEIGRNPDGSKRREYPYEPLPRSGLTHPYVQAILSPWLGSDADHDAIQLGLTTLRTWWQHRRKGESGSAIAALTAEKMRGVVEGYTRHFFNLAHCLIMNDKEQPPRTLHTKMRDLEKVRSKRNKKRVREEEAERMAAMSLNGGMSNHGGFNPDDSAATGMSSIKGNDLDDDHVSPLERLHAAQRRQLRDNGGIYDDLVLPQDINVLPLIPMKGQCVPGKLDLPGVVRSVNFHSSQLAHRGMSNGPNGSGNEYGDANSTPVVFVSHNGDIQIAMSVDGITCAHCVKIVETVLKGCHGNKSPIDGLLDAAADRVLSKILMKIDRSSNAKRIAFEAARNLSMVGYTATPMEMSIISSDGDKKATMDLGALSTAFEVVANTDVKDVFDWNIECTCPDLGILRDDCARHSQMNTNIFGAFQTREKQVQTFMAGCGSKYGMACTCGPNCKCADCSEHCKTVQSVGFNLAMDSIAHSMAFGDNAGQQHFGMMAPVPEREQVSRNPSIISFGNMRHMSITSETTFGRAMSGLSALSIDWENMEDFDINVDHSAHINNGNNQQSSMMDNSPVYTAGGRRSSLRRSITAQGGSSSDDNQQLQVSFKV